MSNETDNRRQYWAVTDHISRENGYGSLRNSISNTMFGLNLRGPGNPTPTNKDHYGYTFFTRPRLNLSYDNVLQCRPMTPILAPNEDSPHRAIRVMLDPVGATAGLRSSMVDNLNAFLPVLSNNLVSLSGWPDTALDTYTSKEGIRKEAWSMVDGVARIMNTFDITATFRNMYSDPITMLFHTWCHYAASVYSGDMIPHADSLLECEIDYMTRIYRIVVGQDRTHITKMTACGAAFPMSDSAGNAFNFVSDKVINDDNDQISIPFRCIGADHFDPILMLEFNATVEMFNRNMVEGVRQQKYHRLTEKEKQYFNYKAYPYINLLESTLEWWIPLEMYKAYLGEAQ